MIEVVVTQLDLAPGAVHALAALLSRTERQRAERLRADRDRRRFIVARARLRQLLARRLGTRPESIDLVSGLRGKPALACNGLHFNVSHSEDIAVYAFSRGGEVGVDVEAIRRLREADDIAARTFSRRENEAYAALEPHLKALGFFNCWTRKEALVKAVGHGLSMPLDDIEVTLAPGEPAKLLRLGDMTGERIGWRLQSFRPAPGFVAALATRN
ncbi:MAG: 4'-phosphopantetheinyl transferase family protein [Steroidobacteraceae bacterium]